MIKYRLKNRITRDLAWALLSPPLLDASLYRQRKMRSIEPSQLQPTLASSHQTPDHWPLSLLDDDYIDGGIHLWLQEIDADPQLLIEHAAQRSQMRVGIYFEQLISFYFTYYPRFTLLQQNLQIQGAERTLGEFDFIVEDKQTNKIIHIETAIKFYLGDLTQPDKIKNNTAFFNWHHWIGPNQKDSLALKMSKLIEHQLQLAKTDEANARLRNLNIYAEKLETRLLLRGRFFCKNQVPNITEYPTFAVLPDNQLLNSQLPNTQLSNKQFLWHRLETFLKGNHPTFLSNEETHFSILPRRYWLSSIFASDLQEQAIESLTWKQLVENISEEIEKGISTWQIAELKTDEKVLEKQRFFLIK